MSEKQLLCPVRKNISSEMQAADQLPIRGLFIPQDSCPGIISLQNS